jgi:LysM repeat protein
MLPLIVLSFACATRPLPPIAASPVLEEAPSPPEAVVDVSPAPPLVPLEGSTTYELRRGETLHHFARWSELPVEVIADASGLSLEQDQLPVGTVVRLPLDEDRLGQVEMAREAHRIRRAEGWLKTRGGEVGTEFHRVRTGETAWSIAHDHGQMPVWVIETYNPMVDLEALRPGQQLMLPLLADGVDPHQDI